tara:strand:- start:4288 stop:6138 length:1851 start_codon:yes stop_codon:yes gene_type:complete
MAIFSNISNEIPILGVLFSILLFTGFYQIGNFICKFRLVNQALSIISDVDYLKHALGVIFLLVIIHPVILFFPYSKEFLYSISFILLILGAISFTKFSTKIIFFKEFLNFKVKNLHKDKYVIIFIIIGLLLLSLAPNTDADSLDYHLRTAKFIAKYGKFPENIFHFHERLSGPGEIIIAIGILCGASSFGSFIQASGLIILYGIFKKISLKKNINSSIFFLVLLTAPIIIFLTSTAKPQLFFICSSSIVFALYFFDKKTNKNQNLEVIKIIISLIIIYLSFQAKFSFILSSFCFFILLFANSFIKKNIKEFIFISITLALFIVLPPMIWKYIKFEFSLFEQLISPVPLNISGMDYFLLYLTRLGGGKSFFSYIIPEDLHQFTNSLGLGLLFIFLFRFEKNSKTKIIFFLIFSFIIISYFFGQRTERFFYEPLIWIIFSSIFFGIRYKLNFLKYLFRFQVYGLIVVIIYALINLSSGSITKELREKVLKKNANGYSLYKWANETLDDDDLILTLHRSISFRFDKSLHFEFIPFRGLQGHTRERYINILIKKKPKYLLTYGKGEMPKVFDEIKKCVGKLVYFKKDVGIHGARNPFRAVDTYNGYIYIFNNDLLPDCIE